MTNELPDEIAIVTGAGTGIGAAIAKSLSDHWPVICIGRTLEKLETLASGSDGRLLPRVLDVTDRATIDSFAGDLVARGTRIVALVNNAGIGRDGSAKLSQSELRENWDSVIGTNLTGAFQLTMALAPLLKRPGGRIVNIASIAAHNGGRNKGSTVYAASKAGLNGMTVGLAREFADEGITVNAIAPGLVLETEFTARWDPERIQIMVDETPVGRAGTPAEIAATTAFLCSPEAGYITGAVIHQNGGTYFGP
ncbi:SDR family oxidoreductase [Nisaea sp.]|uniref:SDR family NAD(P)-dependent oxidoreductase n=1 Tax=Nisaea sp. TaxID=2024842 RepID=UPI0032988863